MLTPSPSATSQPTPTGTPLVILVSVTVDTNCRSGPGQVFDYLGGLMVGETAEVTGRDPTGRYWYIRNPDASGFCWIWGQYASITGETGQLPVFTPAPTPTPVPSFSFVYDSWGVGAGFQCLVFAVTNTGALAWESYALTVNDTTQSYSTSVSSDQFLGYDSWCLSTGSQPSLSAGGLGPASIITHIPLNPSGNNFEVDLKLCSDNGLGGDCQVKSISFIF